MDVGVSVDVWVVVEKEEVYSITNGVRGGWREERARLRASE